MAQQARIHSLEKASSKRVALETKYDKMSKKWSFAAGSTAAKMMQGVMALVGIGFGIADSIKGVDKLTTPHAFSEGYRQGAELLELASEGALTMYDAMADTCGAHGSNAGAVFETAGASSACECQ